MNLLVAHPEARLGLLEQIVRGWEIRTNSLSTQKDLNLAILRLLNWVRASRTEANLIFPTPEQVQSFDECPYPLANIDYVRVLFPEMQGHIEQVVDWHLERLGLFLDMLDLYEDPR